MQRTEITWEDPPDSRSGGSRNDWAAVAHSLKEHPGKWALVKEGPRGRSGTVKYRLQSLGCEATTRTEGPVERLYARWPEDAS